MFHSAIVSKKVTNRSPDTCGIWFVMGQYWKLKTDFAAFLWTTESNSKPTENRLYRNQRNPERITRIQINHLINLSNPINAPHWTQKRIQRHVQPCCKSAKCLLGSLPTCGAFGPTYLAIVVGPTIDLWQIPWPELSAASYFSYKNRSKMALGWPFKLLVRWQKIQI